MFSHIKWHDQPKQELPKGRFGISPCDDNSVMVFDSENDNECRHFNDSPVMLENAKAAIEFIKLKLAIEQ